MTVKINSLLKLHHKKNVHENHYSRTEEVQKSFRNMY